MFLVVQVNLEKNHAFAEFITPEDATAALAFDGVTLHGTALTIRRPKDFVKPSVS
jgi:splicing factor U2AF subunit